MFPKYSQTSFSGIVNWLRCTFWRSQESPDTSPKEEGPVLSSSKLPLSTVGPGFIEHSKETEIGSIYRGFVIYDRLLR